MNALSKWLALLGFAVVVAGTLGRHRLNTGELRIELESLRREHLEYRELIAENRRLKAKQIDPDELARLRADHSALPRLRTEVEGLKNTAPHISP